ncbi:hypothetical protein [Novosphingopyxis sp.]|uniref:hypothetical protein n=1 Tax=Novosphingopyxis sp. TaxID=2709690 RepID=UPI003B5C767C
MPTVFDAFGNGLPKSSATCMTKIGSPRRVKYGYGMGEQGIQLRMIGISEPETIDVVHAPDDRAVKIEMGVQDQEIRLAIGPLIIAGDYAAAPIRRRMHQHPHFSLSRPFCGPFEPEALTGHSQKGILRMEVRIRRSDQLAAPVRDLLSEHIAGVDGADVARASADAGQRESFAVVRTYSNLSGRRDDLID